MAKVSITFDTDSASFDEDRGAEIAATLRRIADKAEAGEECGLVVDVNGNTIGEWDAEDDSDDAYDDNGNLLPGDR